MASILLTLTFNMKEVCAETEFRVITQYNTTLLLS